MKQDIVIHASQLDALDEANLRTLLSVLELPHSETPAPRYGEIDQHGELVTSQLPPFRNPTVHTDDVAIDRFAQAMKDKMAASREKGRTGWDDRDACSDFHLAWQLVAHLYKGDPVDVANFAMMLHQRGAGAAVLPSALGDRLRKLEDFVEWVRNAQVSSGVCCCGDDMVNHGNHDHSPVDEWDHGLIQWLRELGK